MAACWEELPTELQLMVISYLPPRELLQFVQVCRRNLALISDENSSAMLLRRDFPLAAARLSIERETRGSKCSSFEMYQTTARFASSLRANCPVPILTLPQHVPLDEIKIVNQEVVLGYDKMLIIRSLRAKRTVYWFRQGADHCSVFLFDLKTRQQLTFIEMPLCHAMIEGHITATGFCLFVRRRGWRHFHSIHEFDLSGKQSSRYSSARARLESREEDRHYLAANDTHLVVADRSGPPGSTVATSTGYGRIFNLESIDRSDDVHGNWFKLDENMENFADPHIDDKYLYFAERNTHAGVPRAFSLKIIDLESGERHDSCSLLSRHALLRTIDGHVYLVTDHGISLLRGSKSFSYTIDISQPTEARGSLQTLTGARVLTGIEDYEDDWLSAQRKRWAMKGAHCSEAIYKCQIPVAISVLPRCWSFQRLDLLWHYLYEMPERSQRFAFLFWEVFFDGYQLNNRYSFYLESDHSRTVYEWV